MNIKNILYSKNSSFLLSILFGIGLISFIFACTGENCISFKGPEKEDLNKIYRSKDDCFKFDLNLVKCDDKKNQVNFA
tara:strand:- start:1203 stop:1436 length:234 start_codon:yes stop_codon:yes gene_type:complete